MNATLPNAQGSPATDDLDEALEDTFPASDPPAMNQPTRAIPPRPSPDSGLAYAVLCEGVADRPLADWRTCGHARWTSARNSVVILAMSPALAVLDAMAIHGMREDCRWMLACVHFPADRMHRLDTPHEGWKDRTYRDEVRADGDRWVADGGSVLLRVPSPRCPHEYNVLVNLQHPDHGCVQVGDVQPLDVDARFITG